MMSCVLRGEGVRGLDLEGLILGAGVMMEGG